MRPSLARGRVASTFTTRRDRHRSDQLARSERTNFPHLMRRDVIDIVIRVRGDTSGRAPPHLTMATPPRRFPRLSATRVRASALFSGARRRASTRFDVSSRLVPRSNSRTVAHSSSPPPRPKPRRSSPRSWPASTWPPSPLRCSGSP